jgi:hypothetical protein
MVVWNKARGKGESLFGKKYFVHPAILVGQKQNNLRVRYTWSNPTKCFAVIKSFLHHVKLDKEC